MAMDGEKSLSDPAKWSMSKVGRAVCKSAGNRRGEESFVQRSESSITEKRKAETRLIIITVCGKSSE